MSIAVDAPAGTRPRVLVEDLDDAFEPDPDADRSTGERRACPRCGVVLVAAGADDASVVPDHAVCPSARDPFGIRACPGSGTAFGDPVDRAADPTSPAPARSVVTVLPAGLDWRAQPFSHTT
ncbi:hypothetical protein [Embleya scabrispora]|uniref:hypothetical protein n=1 Tax=Embleya scabrispora TaxID=159449 RepID=UPI00039E5B87|nr:hypothetical protein [Embleya scabrispora]MYS83126.1 hypothetical protein [Streptomyces sp. SID5474]